MDWSDYPVKSSTDHPINRVSKRPFQSISPWLVMLLLVLATMACVLSSADMLNDGKGTRKNPVPPRTYAHTFDYDVRALSAVWEEQNDSQVSSAQDMRLRVQFQIRCNKAEDEICQLVDIRQHIKLVDTSGIIYEPVFSLNIDDPLEGEILGGGEKAGWLIYQIPQGAEISASIAEYGQEQGVFFQLP
jgi:hypothetical protein